MIEYEFCKQKVVYGSHGDASFKTNEDAMNVLTTDINTLLETRSKLQDLRRKYTAVLEEQLLITKSKINGIHSKKLEMRDNILKSEDSMTRKNEIELALSYSSDSDLQELLEREKKLSFLIKTSDYLYLISSFKGDKVIVMQETKPSILPKKNNDPVEKKLKQKIKQAQKQNITSSFEDLNTETKSKKELKKLLFNNLQDCVNNKRSAKTYMTKENIIKVIEETPSLKQKMPKNYKTLKKENICDNLFGE